MHDTEVAQMKPTERSKRTFEMLLTAPLDTSLMAAIINGDMSVPVVTDRVDDVYTTPVDISLAGE